MSTRFLAMVAAFTSLGVILAFLFHLLGPQVGRIFLPMHLPVFLAGFLLGWSGGLLVGLFSPLLGALLTGIPPFIPTAVLMVPEMATYGAVCGFLGKDMGVTIRLTLPLAMLAGRVILGLMVALFGAFLGIEIPILIYIKGMVLIGLPGLVSQLVLVPLLVKRFPWKL